MWHASSPITHLNHLWILLTVCPTICGTSPWKYDELSGPGEELRHLEIKIQPRHASQSRRDTLNLSAPPKEFKGWLVSVCLLVQPPGTDPYQRINRPNQDKRLRVLKP